MTFHPIWPDDSPVTWTGKVFIIGLLYGGGMYWKDWQHPAKRSIAPVPPSDEEKGIEHILSAVGVLQYFLHWEIFFHLPLSTGMDFSMSTFSMRENDYYIKIQPMEWNACIFLDRVDPATPSAWTEPVDSGP